eukprot:scaffold3042_cov127-Skeletonema_dohrnii-CCMP3373.AAC.2
MRRVPISAAMRGCPLSKLIWEIVEVLQLKTLEGSIGGHYQNQRAQLPPCHTPLTLISSGHDPLRHPTFVLRCRRLAITPTGKGDARQQRHPHSNHPILR